MLLFPRQKTHEDYSAVRLDEDAALAGGSYDVKGVSPSRAALFSSESTDWVAEKTLSFVPTPAGFDIVCDVALRRSASGSASVQVGIEVVLNFLAPTMPDRYFESNGERFPLRWSADRPGSELRVVDEWQRASATLHGSAAQSFWVAPIETVSESEDGFERIYQGSQILAVWPVDLAAGAEWKAQLRLQVARRRFSS